MATKFDVAKRKLRNKEKERSKRNLLSAMFYSNSIKTAEEDKVQPDKIQQTQEAHEETADKLLKMYSKNGDEIALTVSEDRYNATPTPAQPGAKSYMAEKFKALGLGPSLTKRDILQKPIAVPVKLNEEQKNFFIKQGEQACGNSTVEIEPGVMAVASVAMPESSPSSPDNELPPLEMAAPRHSPPSPRHLPANNVGVTVTPGNAIKTLSENSKQIDWRSVVPNPNPKPGPTTNPSPRPSPKPSSTTSPNPSPRPSPTTSPNPNPEPSPNPKPISRRDNDHDQIERISGKKSSDIGREGGGDKAGDGEDDTDVDEEEEEAVYGHANSTTARGSSGDLALRKAVQLLKFYKKEVETLAISNKLLVTENFKLLIDNKNISTHLNQAVGILEKVKPAATAVESNSSVQPNPNPNPNLKVSVSKVPAIDTLETIRHGGGNNIIDNPSPTGYQQNGSGFKNDSVDNDSLGSSRSHNSHISKRSTSTSLTNHSNHSQITVGAGSDMRVVPADLRGNKPSRLGLNIAQSSVTDIIRHSPPPVSPPAQTVTKQYLSDINNAYIEEKRRKLESELSNQKSITENAVRRVRDNYVPCSPEQGSVSSVGSASPSIALKYAKYSPQAENYAKYSPQAENYAKYSPQAVNYKTSSTSLLPREGFKLPYENLWVAIDSFHSFREAQLAHETISNDFRSYRPKPSPVIMQTSPQRQAALTKSIRSSGYGQSHKSTYHNRKSHVSRSGTMQEGSNASVTSNSSNRSPPKRFNSKYSAVQIRYDLDRRVWVVEGIKNSSLQLHKPSPARTKPSPARTKPSPAKPLVRVVERVRGRAVDSRTRGRRSGSLSSQRSVSSNASGRSSNASVASGSKRHLMAMHRNHSSSMPQRSHSSMDYKRHERAQAKGGGRSSSSYQSGRSGRNNNSDTLGMPDIKKRVDAEQRDRKQRLLVKKRAKERENAFFNAAQATLDSLLMTL